MPGPRDRNKRSWHPSERDWALARELASAREARRSTAAWVLLTRMPADMGNASYDDGRRVMDVTNGLWGVYGDTEELRRAPMTSVPSRVLSQLKSGKPYDLEERCLSGSGSCLTGLSQHCAQTML